MRCELQPDYLSFAAGSLEEPERDEIKKHLAEGCEHCASGVRAARAWLSSMGGSEEGPEPPRALRDHVLALAGAADRPPVGRLELVSPGKASRRRGSSWTALALAAGIAFVACLPAVLWYLHTTAQQADAAQLLADERRSNSALREQIAKLKSAGGAATVPIFSLDFERGGPPKTLAIPPGAGAVVLALPQDLMRQASAAQLRNAADQPVWTLTPLAHGGADLTGLQLPAGELPSGLYSLILRTQDRTIASFPFRVAAR